MVTAINLQDLSIQFCSLLWGVPVFVVGGLDITWSCFRIIQAGFPPIHTLGNSRVRLFSPRLREGLGLLVGSVRMWDLTCLMTYFGLLTDLYTSELVSC